MSSITRSIIRVTSKIAFYLLHISLFSVLIVWSIWLFESKLIGDAKMIVGNIKPYITIVTVFSTTTLCIVYIINLFCKFIVKIQKKYSKIKTIPLLHESIRIVKSAPEYTKTPKSNKNSILFVFISVIIVGLFFRSGLIPEPKNSDGLIAKYKEFADLNNRGEYGVIYDHYLTPDFKASFSKDEFVTKSKENFNTYSKQDTAEIHEAIMNENVGYIDRTLTNCNNEGCSSKLTNRAYRKFVYVDGHWLADLKNFVSCPRDVPYSMPPEFERAVSLLIQRFQGNGDQGLSFMIGKIKNCLNIQYSTNSYELNQAEGVFRFIPGQSHKRLDILVSPNYIYKDDLITATLLAHEITHAVSYIVGEESGKPSSCFEDEGLAFNNQNFFLTKLNPEELNSLVARLNSGGSIELRQINYVFAEIPRYPGNTMIERAENYVRGNPFYQKQCAGRN